MSQNKIVNITEKLKKATNKTPSSNRSAKLERAPSYIPEDYPLSPQSNMFKENQISIKDKKAPPTLEIV